MLAPHYSALSIEKYRAQLEEALAGRAELLFVERWGDEPGFVELLADRVRDTAATSSSPRIPSRRGSSTRATRTRTSCSRRHGSSPSGPASDDWSFSYQSESPTGEPWLGPDILDHLATLSGLGVERVLVCPVGFVADHLEIRWDLDTEAAQRARELGLDLTRIEMPNADPAFVRVLAGLVRRALGVVPRHDAGRGRRRSRSRAGSASRRPRRGR